MRRKIQKGGIFPYLKAAAKRLYKDRKLHKAHWRKHGKLLKRVLGTGM